MYANIPFILKAFHILPVIPVYMIIFTVIFSFTKFYLFDHNPFGIIKVLNILFFYFSATMVLINHGLSMYVSPGYVRYGWEPSVNINKPPEVTEKLFCKQCNQKRPERAHHCKICKKCVLKMDHHCPWVANCVGFYNQKYFLLFLFYAVLGNLIALITFLFKLIYVDFSVKKNPNTDIKNFSFVDLLWLMWDPILLLTATVVSMGMVIAIGLLLIVQLRFILTNSTTVESHIYDHINVSPWSFPNKSHNFKIVMGDKVYQWFLPMFSQNIYNNGYSYLLPGQERTITSIKLNSLDTTKYAQLEEIVSTENSNYV